MIIVRSFALALGSLLVGCKFAPVGAVVDDATPPGGEPAIDPDAPPPPDTPPPPDAPPDAPLPSAACFGTFATICLPALPATPRQFNGGQNVIVDTDTSALCALTAEGTTVDACVVAATSVTVDGTLVARGSRPLVVLATEGDVVVNGAGKIDGSSRRGQPTGAGANPAGCNPGAMAATAGGGGFGGSYGGAGGSGGTGGSGNGGVAAGAAQPTVLAGGCRGGDGGGALGTGGSGGGALLLIATGQISINGTIEASGAGGLGAGLSASIVAGGGGGGSGGMIVFDAPQFEFNNGALIAQGGGGGEGNTTVLAGDVGDDPNPGQPGAPAAGGSGGGGGDGGSGATGGPADSGGSGGALSGGGGGGGGTGFIIVRATGVVINGPERISPPAS